MDSSITSDMDVSKLKVPDLRKELKIRGLSTAGNKNELLERLQSAMKNDKAEDVVETASVDDLEEDLLNEEDDESHIGENDSVLQDIDATLDKSPVESKPSQGTKRKSDEGTTNGTTVKKIILNRSITTEETSDSNGAGVTTESVASSDENKEKKVIKLSELTAKERLEMRAKKFGTPLTVEAKKEVRAERFGTSKSSETTAGGKTKVTSTPIAAATAASADVLKQRAERFGVKTSTTLTKLENQEKLDKRKARFGGASTASASNGAAATLTKAQQRLERFKQPVK